MKFSPSEMFWIAIFGVTVMAGLSSGSVFKGLLGGMFGLLISTIGYSPIFGLPRFVFSRILVGGVAIVPVLIGLFAIPQVFELSEKLHHGVGKLSCPLDEGRLSVSLRQMLGMGKALGVGSLVGSIIVIIGALSFLLFLQAMASGAKQKNKSEQSFIFGPPIMSFILIFIYITVMERLGFYLSTFLFLLTTMIVLGKKKTNPGKGAVMALISLGFTLILFILFHQVLLVQTPTVKIIINPQKTINESCIQGPADPVPDSMKLRDKMKTILSGCFQCSGDRQSSATESVNDKDVLIIHWIISLSLLLQRNIP